MRRDDLMLEKICNKPKLGDKLKDSYGQVWAIVTPCTLAVANLAIAEGNEFVYADHDADNELIANFMASQVQLGREFAEVLHANLWDLYQSDDRSHNAKHRARPAGFEQ